MNKRPFVVCRMLTSLDGKIDGDFFKVPAVEAAQKAYGDLRAVYDCQATVYGTTTMLGGYADGVAPELENDGSVLSVSDHVDATGKAVGNFIVAIDPTGILAYSGPTLAKKGRAAAHVIEVLTEQVSPAYTAYLRERGISYLFCGKDQLNMTLLLEKLAQLFDITRVMVAGGGVLNASFLQEDCIDILSLVLAPLVDGSTTTVSIVEHADFLPQKQPVSFALKEARPLKGGVLWLQYEAPREERQA